ncbi:MAG: hypothetical protein ABJC66_12110 [Gammaproteobacteria bacterium]
MFSDTWVGRPYHCVNTRARITVEYVESIGGLPRVTQPVLMLNGSFDMFFPVETSQKPMFGFLGTPQKQKKMIVYPSRHLVPWPELIRETLAWYDATLGSVK